MRLVDEYNRYVRLRDLTETPTDYLDAYCEAEFGHTNWAFRVRADMFMLDPDVEAVVIFYKHSTKEKHE